MARKISDDEKRDIIKHLVGSTDSTAKTASRFGVSPETIKDWIYKSEKWRPFYLRKKAEFDEVRQQLFESDEDKAIGETIRKAASKRKLTSQIICEKALDKIMTILDLEGETVYRKTEDGGLEEIQVVLNPKHLADLGKAAKDLQALARVDTGEEEASELKKATAGRSSVNVEVSNQQNAVHLLPGHESPNSSAVAALIEKRKKELGILPAPAEEIENVIEAEVEEINQPDPAPVLF